MTDHPTPAGEGAAPDDLPEIPTDELRDRLVPFIAGTFAIPLKQARAKVDSLLAAADALGAALRERDELRGRLNASDIALCDIGDVLGDATDNWDGEDDRPIELPRRSLVERVAATRARAEAAETELRRVTETLEKVRGWARTNGASALAPGLASLLDPAQTEGEG